jgi:hypothetical protein
MDIRGFEPVSTLLSVACYTPPLPSPSTYLAAHTSHTTHSSLLPPAKSKPWLLALRNQSSRMPSDSSTPAHAPTPLPRVRLRPHACANARDRNKGIKRAACHHRRHTHTYTHTIKFKKFSCNHIEYQRQPGASVNDAGLQFRARCAAASKF